MMIWTAQVRMYLAEVWREKVLSDSTIKQTSDLTWGTYSIFWLRSGFFFPYEKIFLKLKRLSDFAVYQSLYGSDL